MEINNEQNIKTYLYASSYIGIVAYLLLDPHIKNHDKVLTFSLINLALLIFIFLKNDFIRNRSKN